MNKKMHLSLLSLVGAILLFVFTSLAWFTISEIVDIGMFEGNVEDRNLDFILYESDDGVSYTEITSIDFDPGVPGNIKYYRIVITNPSSDEYSVYISLMDVTDAMADGSPYVGPESLMDVIDVTTTIDTITVVDDTIANLYDGQNVIITNSFLIAGGGNETVDFTFEFSSAADNQYQNLGINIDNVMINFNLT